jgi:hypothetical protein
VQPGGPPCDPNKIFGGDDNSGGFIHDDEEYEEDPDNDNL